MKNLPPLPPLPRQRSEGVTQQKTLRVCEVCGQQFDTTDIDQVFYHAPEPHEPYQLRGVSD